MDTKLFDKYSKVVASKRKEKDEIIDFIFLTTQIQFINEEIIIEKKKIQFHTSSVKKTIFQRKIIRDFFIEKGYSIQL